MNVFSCLRSIWLWLRDSVVWFFRSSKHDHDSDASSDDEDPSRRITHNSSTGIIDEYDHLLSPLSRISDGNAPNRALKRRLKRNAVTLKNPYCIVIINMYYEDVIAPRNGAQADLENITRLLCTSAGFNAVHVHLDQTRKDILEVMDDISTSGEIEKHDGLIVFISSHGKRKGILCKDKKIVEVDEITSRVNGRQCENLRGKPKLFFISACRGKKTDPGVPGPVLPDAPGDEKLVPKLPTEADFLICYSSTRDHISLRRFELGVTNNRNMGTWLISSVTQIFEDKMKEEDVMQMLARVNSRVANMSSHGDHVDGVKQMPVQMHMLRHRVFLGSA